MSKLGRNQRICLSQFQDCVSRTKKKANLSGTYKLVEFMLKESSVLDNTTERSYSRTVSAIDLINKKLCPGTWCNRMYCHKYSGWHAYNCTKTRPSVCSIYNYIKGIKDKAKEESEVEND